MNLIKIYNVQLDCPGTQLSRGAIFLVHNCPWAQLSWYAIVLGPVCPGRLFPGRNCPGRNCPRTVFGLAQPLLTLLSRFPCKIPVSYDLEPSLCLLIERVPLYSMWVLAGERSIYLNRAHFSCGHMGHAFWTCP